jgi:hypothetical protein
MQRTRSRCHARLQLAQAVEVDVRVLRSTTLARQLTAVMVLDTHARYLFVVFALRNHKLVADLSGQQHTTRRHL